jgi:hypothetical protein
MEPAGQGDAMDGLPLADGSYVPDLRFLWPDRTEYGIMCAVMDLEPTRRGWGAVLYQTPDGSRFTLLTSDIDYMLELGETESAGVSFRFRDLELDRFERLRDNWPLGWEQPRGRIPARVANFLFGAEYTLLALVALRATGVNLFPWLRPTVPLTALTLGIAVLTGLLFLVLPLLVERPSGLIGAAARWDQEAVRRRVWALLGVVIGLGGLAGLAVTHVLTSSDRQALTGSAIGGLVAAAGGIGRVIGRRRSLGQEAVALLRRACRNPATLLSDSELARLEVLLTATWIPGSRTSWMTARTARIFTSELGKSEQARSKYLPDCLIRTLDWVENGSGLVGAFHAGIGLAGELTSIPDQSPSVEFVMRTFRRLSRWRPRMYKRSAAAGYSVPPVDEATREWYHE